MYEVVFPGGIFVLISILRAALLVVLFGFSAKGFAAAPTVVTVAASGITLTDPLKFSRRDIGYSRARSFEVLAC